MKYTRMVYPYTRGSYFYVNPVWTKSKPITIVELFTVGYILRRGYYNLSLQQINQKLVYEFPL